MKTLLIQSGLLIGLQLLVSAATAQTMPSPPDFPIEGRVYSPDGKPIAAALVSAYDIDRVAMPIDPIFREDGNYPVIGETKTDAQGRFRIENRSKAEFGLLVVRAGGFGMASLMAPLNGLDDPLTIEMRPGATLKAQVVDLNEAPIAGVRITPSRIFGRMGETFVALPNALRAQLAQISDVSGMVTFADMPPGAGIDIGHQDERFVRGDPNQSAITVGDTRVAVIHLDSAASVEGRVMFADTGKPAAGVEVLCGEILNANGSALHRAVTDADGRYRIGFLRASSLQLLAHPAGAVAARVAGIERAAIVDHGQKLVDQDLQLVPGTAIRGSVKTNDGKPVADVGITVAPIIPFLAHDWTAGSAAIQTVTAEDGSYEVHVLPGEFRVTIAAPNRLNLTPAEDFQKQVTIEQDKPAFADFTLEPALDPSIGIVKGTVVDEAGHALEAAAVMCIVQPPQRRLRGPVLFSGGGGIPGTGPIVYMHAATDSNGRFELPAYGREASLEVRKGELSASMSIKADNPTPLLMLKRVSGTLVIHTMQPDGTSVAGARVEIEGPGIRFAPRWGTSDADGNFTLETAFPARQYEIKVTANGFATVENTSMGLDRKPLFNIEPGKRTIYPVLLYRNDSFIAGFVVDNNGTPLAGVNIAATGARSGRQADKSDLQGHFLIENLVPGEPVSIITAIGSGRSDRNIKVMTGTSDARIVHAPQPGRRRG